MDKIIVGQCPACGANVVKNSRGYKCENNTGDNGQCKFFINELVGNRHLSDNEVSILLDKKELLADGLITKEGKAFTTILRINPEHLVAFDSTVCKCPHCGGDIRVNVRAFGCVNFNNQPNPCSFTIWRNTGGHNLTVDEVREICSLGATSEPVTMFLDDGTPYQKKLGLDQDKLKLIRI